MRRVSFILLLTILSFGVVNHAEAQFWKKLFHKQHHHKTSSHTAKAAKPNTARKKKTIAYVPTEMRSRYRVDVLVPLYLDELVVNNKPAFKDKVPDKALTGIEFYEGVKIAADSLEKEGYKLDIFIHDITTEKGNPEYLINTNRLDSSNLIIGALQTKEIPPVAHFAAVHHINFISALSPFDGNVRDNLYFTLLQPTLQTYCDYIKDILAEDYPKRKIVLYHRNNNNMDESAYKYLTRHDSDVVFRKVLCDTIPDTKYLGDIFDSSVTNVIVIAVLDNTYATRLLKQLSETYPGYRFDIYGLPSWRGMDILRNLGDAIRVNVPAPFNFDAGSPTAKYIERGYRKDFGGKPGELVFRGFETLTWYADLLRKYGTIYNTKTADISHAPFTKFQLRLKWDKDQGLYYSENEHVYLYKYQNGGYKIE